jgi:hypothetical protein
MEEMIKELEQFALDHYEAGGHWVVETHSKEDYIEVLTKAKTVAKAKKELKKYWKLINHRQADCRFE